MPSAQQAGASVSKSVVTHLRSVALVCLQGLGNPNEPFYGLSWDAARVPAGSLLIIFAEVRRSGS